MCGCNKNKRARNQSSSKTNTYFSTSSNKEVRPKFTNQSTTPTRSASGLGNEKRKIEKLRRDAIFNNLGK